MPRVVTAAFVAGLLCACDANARRADVREGGEGPAVEASARAVEVTVRRQEHMTTYVTITVAAAEAPEVLAAIDAAFAVMREGERALSEWIAGNDMARLLEAAGREPVVMGADAYAILEMAQRTSRASSGAFDVTVGSLRGLWDFKWQTAHVPSARELERKLALVDYRKLVLDPGRRTAFLRERGMGLALGGITKGFLVDRASRALRDLGWPNHLIVAGGDGYAAGRKGAVRWRIGVRHPRGELHGALEVEDEGFATSGNYERYFIKDGVRYHHILDPKTGMPSRGLAGATVLAKDAMTADAFATAVFVSGAAKGLELARAQGLDVLLFTEDRFAVLETPGMTTRVSRLAPGDGVAPPFEGGTSAPWVSETPR